MFNEQFQLSSFNCIAFKGQVLYRLVLWSISQAKVTINSIRDPINSKVNKTKSLRSIIYFLFIIFYSSCQCNDRLDCAMSSNFFTFTGQVLYPNTHTPNHFTQFMWETNIVRLRQKFN